MEKYQNIVCSAKKISQPTCSICEVVSKFWDMTHITNRILGPFVCIFYDDLFSCISERLHFRRNPKKKIFGSLEVSKNHFQNFFLSDYKRN